MSDEHSPRIDGMDWGEVRVGFPEGPRSFKDAKLWPGGAREWDWNETGTRHRPGIQPADVEELVENGAEIVVLSQGQNRRLQVMSETLSWLSERDVEAEVLESNEAVERYNELAGDRSVGALIHSTC